MRRAPTGAALAPAIAAAVAAALAGAPDGGGPPSPAHAAAVPASAAPGSYGGGAVLSPPAPLGGAGDMLVGLRVRRDGRLEARAGLGAPCAGTPFRVDTALAADGSFAAAGTRRRRLRGGVVVRTRWEIAGAFAGAGASGSARVRNRVGRRGHRQRSCSSGPVRWSARRAVGEVGAPGGGDGALYGTTAQRLQGPRRAIVMRVAGAGTRLERALYDVTMRCGGGRWRSDVFDGPRRDLAIGPDGRFADVERFERREGDAVRRDVERFAGQVGTAGAAGTFSIVSRLVGPGGRTLERCSSGRVRWTAAR